MPVTQGCLETSQGLQLPLQGTNVRVEVMGPLAEVTVQQSFTNPLSEAIEATYQFPIPHGAAVYQMRFEVGGRVVENVVKELEEARADFARARAEGKRASLLEQQKPNLFSMALTHIQPGETIQVTLAYFELLDFEEGRYRWTFPMVAGDRNRSKEPIGDAQALHARRLASQQRATDVQLQVELGDAEAFPESPTHHLKVEGATVTLAPGDALPNRDFVLYWTALPSQVYVQGDTFLFQMLAPQDEAAELPPQNVLILLDRSCSMRGQAMEQARRAVDHVLSVLRPEDRFRIVAFDHDGEEFTGDAVAARAWLRDLAPRGGTELELVLKQAETHQGSVLLITDASVGNEEFLLKRVPKAAPLHVLGIGAAVNRYLAEGLARAGGGTCQFLTPFEDPTTVLQRLGRRLLQAAPTLSELKLEWPEARLVYPEALPSLYERQPLVLVGRFTGPSQLVLRGKRQDGREYRLEKEVGASGEPGLSGLERLWAQRRIAAITNRAEIVELAVRYSLASPHTAFVGVDSEQVDTAAPKAVTVAVEEVAGSPEDRRSSSTLTGGGDMRLKLRAMPAFSRGEDYDEDPSPRAAPPASPPLPSACRAAPFVGGASFSPPFPETDAFAAPAAAPFGAPAADPFASAAPAADPFGGGGDPFACAAASVDPFCPPSPGDPFAYDPFAEARPGDPFAPRAEEPPDPFGPSPDPWALPEGVEAAEAFYRRVKAGESVPFGSPPPAELPLPPELLGDDYGTDELAWAEGKLDAALDLVFLVDETGSMGPYIQTVQQQLLYIVETVSRLPLCRRLRLGLVRYRDHPPQETSFVTMVHALSEDIDEVRKAVLTMQANGGGDAPEAVTDGLFELVNLNWRPGSVRTVVWIGDAPPHGVSRAGDGFPNGCPCGRHWYAQAESCREMSIAVHAVVCGHADETTKDVYQTVARAARGVCVTLAQATLLVPLITGVAARDLDRLRVEARVAEILAAHEAARSLERDDQVEFLTARLARLQVRAELVQEGSGISLRFRDLTPEDVEAALDGLEFRRLELAAV